ncbi:MAG TPA: helix-turn-helix domain-containing protein [Anaeromyxobacteraceae bacterium]|nr:helix-turn-helix domain-containing protein [Anaeromyxobacteraceae bacterium]
MRGFYTTYEAAHVLGVSLPTVVNWVKARRLKAHRTPGGHRRISREDLAAFMHRHGMPLPPELDGAVEARRKALVLGEAGPGREGLVRQLAEAGYAVEQAAHGFAAGAATARFRPDVVVLVADAPDGGDTLKALRADRESGGVPVVGVGSADWGARLQASGCAAAVGRPLSDGVLSAALSQALSGAALAAPRRRR